MLYYILKDHLGSASVVTDSIGDTVGEQRYYPYGETRFTSGTINTDELFTGQREMTGLGIYHYGARFRVAPPKRSGAGYSPKLGRFLSADTIVPGAANPQAWNRYSYVLGNPLKYIDPTGHYCVGDDEDCADEAGYGPAPTGTGGNNGNGGGGGGGGDPHDDDDVDPNPLGLPAPTQTPTITPPVVEIPPVVTTPPPCSSLMCNPNLTGPWPPIASSDETCEHCGMEFFGFLALLEGTQLALVGGAAAYFVIIGAPLWAAVIPAAIFVGVAFLDLNWAIAGVQEIYAGTHPNEHVEIDYLPLVPDSWHR